MKKWTTVFKALANINRLKIISLLSGGKSLSVTDLAGELKISLKSTSKHLIILSNLDVLENRGTAGHVFYSLNPNMSIEFKRAIKLLT